MSNDETSEKRTDSNKREDAEYSRMIREQLDKVDDLFEIRHITPENAEFRRTVGGFLMLRFQDKEYPRVAVHRAFPFTSPDRYLSIRDVTPKCEEIGMIRDLADWPEDIRVLIREQLDIRYFTPEILEILDVHEEYGFAYWEVRTDRGPMKFTTSVWNPITRLGEDKLLVNDLDGNRYGIRDIRKLTRKEIKRIDLFL